MLPSGDAFLPPEGGMLASSPPLLLWALLSPETRAAWWAWLSRQAPYEAANATAVADGGDAYRKGSSTGSGVLYRVTRPIFLKQPANDRCEGLVFGCASISEGGRLGCERLLVKIAKSCVKQWLN